MLRKDGGPFVSSLPMWAGQTILEGVSQPERLIIISSSLSLLGVSLFSASLSLGVSLTREGSLEQSDRERRRVSSAIGVGEGDEV